MKFALIGALLITLPALAAIVYALVVGNQFLLYAALVSLSLNSLPFLAAGLLMKNQHGDDADHH